MPADPAFDIVAQLEVEQKNFANDLKTAERLVEQTAQRMEASLRGAAAGTSQLDDEMALLQSTLVTLSPVAALAIERIQALQAAFAAVVTTMNPAVLALGAAATILSVFRTEIRDTATALFSFLSGVEEGERNFHAIDVAIDEMFVGLTKVRREAVLNASVLRGATSELDAYIQKQLDAAPTGLTSRNITNITRMATLTFNALQDEKRAQQEIADEIERKAEAERKYQRDIDATQDALARQLAEHQELAQIRLQTDVIAGRVTEDEAILATNSALKAKLLIEQQLELSLKNQREEREAELRAFLASQSAAEEGLARSLAIQAGIRKESDFAVTDRERQLLLIQEALNAKTPSSGGGFSIGTRQASEFFGFAGQNLQLGQQREQEKTNEKLDEANRLNQRQIDVLLELANGTGLN